MVENNKKGQTKWPKNTSQTQWNVQCRNETCAHGVQKHWITWLGKKLHRKLLALRHF